MCKQQITSDEIFSIIFSQKPQSQPLIVSVSITHVPSLSFNIIIKSSGICIQITSGKSSTVLWAVWPPTVPSIHPSTHSLFILLYHTEYLTPEAYQMGVHGWGSKNTSPNLANFVPWTFYHVSLKQMSGPRGAGWQTELKGLQGGTVSGK